MNILVFGWYHHQNAGDDRIQQAITRWFDGHTLAFLPAGRVPPVSLLRSYDAALIGGGGLIMARGGVFQNMAQWVRAAGIPVALVGISIERITEPLRDELRGFLAGAELAWFRDRASLDEVGADARAFVAPDLSWLLPFPMLPPPGGRAVALALRKQGGLDLERWRAVVARIDRPVRAWPLYFEHEGDREPLKAVLPDEPVPDEFSLRALDSSSIAVSLRYHGILFAVQAGRPVIAVSSQPKVERFMHEQGLGDWHLGDNDIERLPALIDAIARQEAHAIERVRALRARLSSEAAACGSGVRTRLLNAAAQTAGRRERWSRIRRPLGLVARPTR